MRYPICLLAAAALLVGSAFGQPPADPRKSDPNGTSIFDSLSLKPPRTQVAAVGKRYALLVGVEEAEVGGVKQNPLPVCSGDSIAMAAALKSAGYECTILNDAKETGASSRPTVKHSLAAVKAVCDKAGTSDLVLVYFSTHGVILPGKNGLDGPAILAMNDGALKIDDVKAALAGSKALTRVLLLDCCRDNKKFAPKVSEFRDVHVITACRPDEVSQTGPRGLSVFTEAFVAGLTDCRADRYKDGQIELDELLNYCVEQVPRGAREMDEHATQNPTRTVVDPRTVNPIIASCGSTSIYDGLVPTAMQGPVVAVPRGDLVLAGSIAGKIQIGMTEKEMSEAMGRAPDDPSGCEKDDKGGGLAMYNNTPKKNDTVFVFFDGCKVSRVMVMYAKLCDGEFDAARSRKALNSLLNGRPLDEIGQVLGLPSTKELFEQLGCPKGGLMYGEDKESGAVHYDDVPLPGQRLTFRIVDGKVVEVSLDPKPRWAD